MEAFALLARLAILGNGTANNGSSLANQAQGHAAGQDSHTTRRGNEQFSLAAKMKRANFILTRGHGTAKRGHALPLRGHRHGYSLRWDTTPRETVSCYSEA